MEILYQFKRTAKTRKSKKAEDRSEAADLSDPRPIIGDRFGEGARMTPQKDDRARAGSMNLIENAQLMDLLNSNEQKASPLAAISAGI